MTEDDNLKLNDALTTLGLGNPANGLWLIQAEAEILNMWKDAVVACVMKSIFDEYAIQDKMIRHAMSLICDMLHTQYGEEPKEQDLKLQAATLVKAALLPRDIF